MQLTVKQRLSWLAHAWKACAFQYHRDILEPLERHIPPGGLVIDVGAHAGQFSKLFARHSRAGAILAFEPGSYARSILRLVVRLKRLDQVEVLPLALGAEPATVTLNLPVKSSGSLGFGLGFIADGDDHGRPVRSETVTIARLDDVLVDRFGGIPPVSLIKADIEGHELAMLRGARRTLLEARPAIYLEIVADFLERAGDSPADLFAYLRQVGYRPVVPETGTPLDWAHYEAAFADSDGLFLPADPPLHS